MHLRLVKIYMLLLLCCIPSNYLTSVFVDSGNETNECPSAHLFHSLLQSLVRMNVTVHDGTEGSSVSVSHEASGTYSCRISCCFNAAQYRNSTKPVYLVFFNSCAVTIIMRFSMLLMLNC